MSRKEHVVDLSDEDRRTIEWFISTGEHNTEDITQARIRLKPEEGITDTEICEYLDCSIGTPYRAELLWPRARGDSSLQARPQIRPKTQ